MYFDGHYCGHQFVFRISPGKLISHQRVFYWCYLPAILLLKVYCWTYTGERQAQKFREKYVNAILSQEIGWFDTCGAAELSTRVAELTGKIQDGLGRKVGDSLQYVTQVIGSYCVAFYLGWRLAVVLLAAFPLIAGAGEFKSLRFFALMIA